MGLAVRQWVLRWGVAALLLLLAGAAHAQGGPFSNLSETRISLVNPFTGEGITVTVLRVVYIVGGLVLLFAGWSAYRFALATAGFVVGASFGAGLATNTGTVISLIITVACGLVGAALASFVYLLAVALVGGYIGLIVTGRVADLAAIDMEGGLLLLIYALGMMAGAGLALALAVELTIILTSAIGAVMLAGGTGLLATRFGPLWTLLLFAVGVVAQMQVARSRGSNPFERRS